MNLDRLNVDLGLLKAWLTLRFNASPKCFLDGRRKSNASRELRVGDFKSERFRGSSEPFADALRTLVFEIIQSLTKNIPDGEKIAVLGSGGIDSSTVVAILCKLGYRPEVFTIGFGAENDEIESASTLAEHLRVKHHARILTKILGSTSDANRLLAEPYRAACYGYDAYKFTADSGAKYVFDGLGVDEFFGGYDFRYQRIMDLIARGHKPLEAYLRGAHPIDYVESESALFGKKLSRVKPDWARLFPYFDNDLDVIDQIFLADYDGKCRHNFVPLASLAGPLGIRVFYPWLDERFMDFALRVPTNWKYDPKTKRTKILFREAVAGLLPRAVMEKKKQGFGPSLGNVYEELRPLAEDIVLDGFMVSNGYVNGDYYREVMGKKSPSATEINKLWDLYTLEVFLDDRGTA
jgi:asparagine synthetase B (glutamine-hydrolysing)